MSNLLNENLDVQFVFNPYQRKANVNGNDADGLRLMKNSKRRGIVAFVKMYVRVKTNIEVPVANGQPNETETQETLIPLFNGISGTIWGTFAPKQDGQPTKLLSVNADFSNSQVAESGIRYALTPMDSEFEEWAKIEMEAQFLQHKFERTTDQFDSNVIVLSEMADAFMDCAIGENIAPVEEQPPHIADSKSVIDSLIQQGNNGLSEPQV